jgi:hypothetical protein
MRSTVLRGFSWLNILPHLLAGTAAVYYAWIISSTSYVATAVQFVSPLAVIMVIHLMWRAFAGGYVVGFAGQVLGQTMKTAFGLTICVIVFALLAPVPAEASTEVIDTIGFILGAIVCLAIVIGVVYAIATMLFLSFRGLAKMIKAFKKDKGPPGSTLNDLATVIISLAAIAALSLEGTSAMLSFSPKSSAVSRQIIKAGVDQVWKAAATATSPDFPLPAILHVIPKPVKILVDEGLELGARRVVLIAGREGRGELSMRIASKTNTEATFEVLSDTSPVSMWVRAKSLTFRVEPVEGGTLLSVSSEYDRLLSPAWFFRPFMSFAADMAVGTLASDIKNRAEAL